MGTVKCVVTNSKYTLADLISLTDHQVLTGGFFGLSKNGVRFEVAAERVGGQLVLKGVRDDSHSFVCIAGQHNKWGFALQTAVRDLSDDNEFHSYLREGL